MRQTRDTMRRALDTTSNLRSMSSESHIHEGQNESVYEVGGLTQLPRIRPEVELESRISLLC